VRSVLEPFGGEFGDFFGTEEFEDVADYYLFVGLIPVTIGSVGCGS